ncbi:hypothetical protein C8Q75DRAFT_753897 [Abortiporus biennis]|nr:hypothetical protein C8Q75DRAFT_753897 [Abortiporus biennis]
MGRPLFSRQTTTPAVRVEPEQTIPQNPPYERWTYWNAFDPDADEFFESDEAVYEAFIDPSQLPHTLSEAQSGSRETVVEREAEVEVDDSLSTVSSGSSDSASSAGTLSGRESPAGSEEDVPVATLAIDRVSANSPEQPEELQSPSVITSPPNVIVIHNVNEMPLRPSTPERRPATPPSTNTTNENQTPLFFNATPSPPPSLTPRLYSWASRAPVPPVSPLPNRSARMSVSHIQPALIPLQRIVG